MSTISKIKYNPNGQRIFAKIVFKGLVVGSYEYLLWESESNEVLEEKKGNNQNPWDDEFPLPMPVSSNNNRIIDMRAKFVGLDPVNAPEFKISLLIYQGKELIGEAVDESTDDRKLDGKGKTSQLYAILEQDTFTFS